MRNQILDLRPVDQALSGDRLVGARGRERQATGRAQQANPLHQALDIRRCLHDDAPPIRLSDKHSTALGYEKAPLAHRSMNPS